MFLLFNDNTLLSLSENTGQERTATVTVRDASGRYIWNASLHYDDVKQAKREHRKGTNAATGAFTQRCLFWSCMTAER